MGPTRQQILDERLASQPTHSRLLDTLASIPENLESVRFGLADWVRRHLLASGRDRSVLHGTLDLDDIDAVVYGKQEGAEYNAYYGEKVYHPTEACNSAFLDLVPRRDEAARIGPPADKPLDLRKALATVTR